MDPEIAIACTRKQTTQPNFPLLRGWSSSEPGGSSFSRIPSKVKPKSGTKIDSRLCTLNSCNHQGETLLAVEAHADVIRRKGAEWSSATFPSFAT